MKCSAVDDAKARRIKERVVVIGTEVMALFDERRVPRGEAIMALCGLLGTLACRYPNDTDMANLDRQTTIVAEKLLTEMVYR